MDRRTFLWTGGCALAATGATAAPRKMMPWRNEDFHRSVAACEAASGGRLGVAILDTATGARLSWRGDERFPMCSTFKFLLATAILRRVDRGQDRLDRRVRIAASDILDNSPITEQRVGRDASVAELCAATVTRSDNAAANLLLPAVGGPAGLTRFLRGLGDDRTRLDRNEPMMSEAIPGDPRDTTTPLAMLGLLDQILMGRILSGPSRARLTGWMLANQTGDHRLRAGLPATWKVGDKTGTGDHGTTNDIAILWPPARAPLLVTSYLTGTALSSDDRDAIHARLARASAAVPW
jgi:beta-lactamase class A